MQRRALGLRLTHAAVLGHPIDHSLSPTLHRAAYRQLGLEEWDYTAIDCPIERFDPLLARSGPDWVGFSLTRPLKRAALTASTTATDQARQVGAANTLIRDGGGWRADNTDVDGVDLALGETPTVTRWVVLGAGGAAQAAVVALAGRGVRSVTALTRSVGRTAELLATAGRCGVRLERASLADACLAPGDGVISALPAGAADHLAANLSMPPALVFDMVYAPWPTALATAAGKLGSRVVGGHEMLLHQAARQVELMTGRRAPLTAMREALAARLKD